MTKADDKLIREAKDRFQKCEDHEAPTRPLWIEDLKFANADPDNGYQWPHDLKKSRELDKRPCLTINKVKQHNRQITNDARQNKPSVRVQPVDNGADKKTAEILNGIIRHIEANSSADTAYDTAAEFAVDAGIGYWRIVTDYCDENSFDQDIFIKRVKNPLNVYLDPNIQEADGSDARFGFVFEDIPKDEFERRWPDADAKDWQETKDGWITKDTIRIAEYFKIVEEKDTLIADEQGNTILLSKIEDPELAKAAKSDPNLRKRPVTTKKGKWYLLAGDQVLEEKDWLGKYIPIVRVVGEEIEIEGKIDRKGHTRGMKDAQRMYNFWTSSATEHVALQGKQPYLAPAEAIAGYEQYWDNLNAGNQPYLPYNSVDETSGQQIPMPQRQQPPVMAPAYMQGMQVASEEMKMASGQYDSSLGRSGNATSGRQELAQQHKGEVATFHFVDNVARAIKYTGKILVDLIPKLYDTPRIVRILGEDGKEDIVKLDPGLKAPVEERRGANGEIEQIYNPGVGRYDVTVTVGPSYSTKRQEAAVNMIEIAGRNPGMWQTHGDLIVKSQDWPMADEFAKRSEKLLPPELKEDQGQPQIPPEVQQQMEQMGQQLEAAMAELQSLESKAAEVDIKRVEANTRAYDAITKRLQVLGPMLDAIQVQQLAMETQREAMEQIDPGMAAPESMGEPEPPIEPIEPQQAADAAFFTPEA